MSFLFNIIIEVLVSAMKKKEKKAYGLEKKKKVSLLGDNMLFCVEEFKGSTKEATKMITLASLPKTKSVFKTQLWLCRLAMNNYELELKGTGNIKYLVKI